MNEHCPSKIQHRQDTDAPPTRREDQAANAGEWGAVVSILGKKPCFLSIFSQRGAFFCTLSADSLGERARHPPDPDIAFSGFAALAFTRTLVVALTNAHPCL